MDTNAKNVLGTELISCSTSPLTGFYRNDCCHTGPQDTGRHLVCAQMTEAFLTFSAARDNDLMTPLPQFQFPGLQAGDRWCLCVLRWREAYDAGVAPPVILAATHLQVLRYVTLEMLATHELSTS